MPRTPQPLHIFRKDITHLWPETLVVLLLYVALAWSSPSRWSGSDNQLAGLIPLLAILLKAFLLPVGWLVLIARLIHDEPLVGDRQFWTSRPYHWFSLFAAKVLYLLAFIYLPFLLMQVYLLKNAGLYPTTAIPDLLHNLVLLTVFIVVPIAAISAVTSTMMRALLAFVGTILYLLVLAGFVLWAIFRRMPPPELLPVILGLFIVLPLGALIFQYATRRTEISRAILIATPLVITLLFFVIPADAFIRQAYPVTSAPKLGPLPDGFGPKAPQPGNLDVQHGDVQVGIPFMISDVDKDSNYFIKGVSASVDAPGVHWTSPFIADLGTRPINAGTPFDVVPIVMPLGVFNQIGHSPANVHLSIAVEQVKASKPATWKATKEPFAVPGHGVCSFSTEHPDAAPVCQYPFKAPEINYATATVSAACGDASAPKATGYVNLSTSVNFLAFDPVVSKPLEMKTPQAQQGASYQLCPGTDLSFIEGQDKAKNRLEVDVKQIALENYATHIDQRRLHDPRMAPAPDQQ